MMSTRTLHSRMHRLTGDENIVWGLYSPSVGVFGGKNVPYVGTVGLQVCKCVPYRYLYL